MLESKKKDCGPLLGLGVVEIKTFHVKMHRSYTLKFKSKIVFYFANIFDTRFISSLPMPRSILVFVAH